MQDTLRYCAALEYAFKGLSDELEEDEDLHNNLKCDQMTSDEQIVADNAKISTLETSISGENARVTQLTEEIGTLEKDIAASKSEFSDATEESASMSRSMPVRAVKCWVS